MTKSFNALKWTVVERIIWAWLMTIPATATLAYLCHLAPGPLLH